MRILYFFYLNRLNLLITESHFEQKILLTTLRTLIGSQAKNMTIIVGKVHKLRKFSKIDFCGLLRLHLSRFYYISSPNSYFIYFHLYSFNNVHCRILHRAELPTRPTVQKSCWRIFPIVDRVGFSF